MAIDLTTNYGGLVLKNPIVVGACPLMARERSRREVEAAGAAAIVLPSLFEEQWSDGTCIKSEMRPIPLATTNQFMTKCCSDTILGAIYRS